MSPKKETEKSARSATAKGKTANVWTDEERAAMKALAQERKAEERTKKDKAAGESAVLAAIAEMTESDRTLARKLHDIVKSSAPSLKPKTWYGMPAYARDDGKVVCFFQTAQKFNTRYATLGFSDLAHLDDGNLWPVAFALKELTPAEEARISAMVKHAIS